MARLDDLLVRLHHFNPRLSGYQGNLQRRRCVITQHEGVLTHSTNKHHSEVQVGVSNDNCFEFLDCQGSLNIHLLLLVASTAGVDPWVQSIELFLLEGVVLVEMLGQVGELNFLFSRAYEDACLEFHVDWFVRGLNFLLVSSVG